MAVSLKDAETQPQHQGHSIFGARRDTFNSVLRPEMDRAAGKQHRISTPGQVTGDKKGRAHPMQPGLNPVVCLLQYCDIDFVHLKHCHKDALRFLRILVPQQLAQDRGYDLPG